MPRSDRLVEIFGYYTERVDKSNRRQFYSLRWLCYLTEKYEVGRASQ